MPTNSLLRVASFWCLIAAIMFIGIAPNRDDSTLGTLMQVMVALVGAWAAGRILVAEVWHHLTH